MERSACLSGAAKTPIDTLDVAEVIATVSENPSGHVGEVYELTGPRTLGILELATEYSKALGRAVTYVNVPLEQWQTELRCRGSS